MEPKKKITKRVVDSTEPPENGQAFIRDSEIPGFALRITSTGIKSFIWEGRIKGQVKRITLGQYGPLTVEEARKMAIKTKSNVLQGGDPAKERKDKFKEPTFKELSDMYLERYAKIHKRSWKKDDQTLRNHLDIFNGRKLSSITRQDIARHHQKIGTKDGKKNGRYAANRMLEVLRKMFNLAMDWGMMPETINPATKIKKFSEEKRERVLSDDELKAFITTLRTEPDPHLKAYFTLLVLLGPRKNELISAKWQDMDLSSNKPQWRIPETKAGRSHFIPLPTPVVRILEDLKRKSTSPFVFPGNGKSGHLNDPRKAWLRICEVAKIKKARIHDLRRTLGTWLANNGASLLLIGKALNHSTPTSTMIYARMTQDPLRIALEENAERMLKSETG
ncbi:MAG: tyrosine-type recombinase/integrase [Nitrospirae bacterium]|nr:tyrosine-type recombinase/integrase [Nitrospirota bacterium]MBI3352291.1 tyrosine-type recombinase/integrase [Nitrospirota bacterium]